MNLSPRSPTTCCCRQPLGRPSFRVIDHRPFLTNLPEPDKRRIRVLCAGADAIMQTVNTAAQYRQCGLQTDIVPDEGHAWFARNPELFEETLLSWA